MEFGKFLAYYADAPEISLPPAPSKERGEKKPQTDKQKRMNKAEPGYHRLFINLGKRDGFYPGELMQTLNRYVGGRQEVGHIDLLDTISYFEVPEKDAKKVMTQLTGIRYHGRTVRCNSEDEKEERPERSSKSMPKAKATGRKGSKERFDRQPKSDDEWRPKKKKNNKDDWRDLMKEATERNWKFKDEEPDFSEEGWARRKPKRKK
jgi:ATP-dependent RNA helicase DeaD